VFSNCVIFNKIKNSKTYAGSVLPPGNGKWQLSYPNAIHYFEEIVKKINGSKIAAGFDIAEICQIFL
jgi:hypothetical protein